MGKNKRQKHLSHGKKSKPHKLTRPSGISKPQPSTSKVNSKTQKQHRQPTLPFEKHEKILLIGEGDLSFARSLITYHECEDLTATVYESAEELKEKYPQAEENAKAIEEGGGVLKFKIDATRMKPWTRKTGNGQRVGLMDRVFFNFPHVGGKTKDVNKQVRYNQELLVSFFKSSVTSLSPKPGSSIIVTLFEGDPYTLWNIRDLARHSGLEVKQSFRFQAAAYPGYRHARTFGVVKGKNGELGKGWKGEERASRSYEFVRKGEGVFMGPGKGKKGKEESSDDEDDDEAEAEDTDVLEEDGESSNFGEEDKDMHETASSAEDDEEESEDGD